MATKNAIIKGIAPGKTSVTFETTKDWAIPAELQMPIEVIRPKPFYELNEATNGNKSYIVFQLNRKGTKLQTSFKCLRLYLTDGTLLRCVKATRIEDVNANTKHKYFVNLDKGNVTSDLFSVFELYFSTDENDALLTGRQNIDILYNGYTSDDNIKLLYICPTAYYAKYEVAPHKKNEIWCYIKALRDMMECYISFKDANITAEDISKIGLANLSYSDSSNHQNIGFNYLLLKKYNYRGVELLNIEIDENNFEGTKSYYIDLFLKDGTFKMLDYVNDFFNNDLRYNEDINSNEQQYDETITGDTILDEYNKLDKPFNPKYYLLIRNNPTNNVMENVPTSINTSGMDFYSLHFAGYERGYKSIVNHTYMIALCNLRFYLNNGDLLYPINVKKLNADVSADMPTSNTGNNYEEYELIFSKTEPADGYTTTNGTPIDNGISVTDSSDYVKLRVVTNKIYYGTFDLHKYKTWRATPPATNYLSLSDWSNNMQTLQMHILFDNDSNITPDELGKISMNNSIQASDSAYIGHGYIYGFSYLYVARSSSDNVKKSYKLLQHKVVFYTKGLTYYINLNDDKVMLRDAENRFNNTQLADGTIIPERYL